MNRNEVAMLISYATGLDPRTARDNPQDLTDQLDQWEELLRDVPPQAPHPNGRHWNAAEVVRHHIASSPYPIKPSDVSRPWHAFKADVIGRHTDPLPAADPDQPEQWRAELLGTRQAVATGRQQATTYHELTAAPADQLRARLARVGEMPPAIREQIRQTTGGRIGAGKDRFPEMALPCPRQDCRALRHMPCKRPSGKELREHTHTQRQDAYAAALATQEMTA